MDIVDLKAYTTRAKELEVAIHTQKRLMIAQETIIKNQEPKFPKKKELNAPIKPFKSTPVKIYDSHVIAGIVLSVLLFIVFLIFLLLLICGGGVVAILLMTATVISIFCVIKKVIKEINLNKVKNETEEKHYAKRLEEYQELSEKYKKESAISEEDYQTAISNYKSTSVKHSKRFKDTMNSHRNTLSKLENALKQLYSEDIIFPKYKNIIAITTINEYLMSGRCDKLEGPDGAYNLYEMELRQNIIIAQLSSILDNLEQIRNNQYTLYKELQKSNLTIDEILQETRRMKETTKLTAYFAGVTALAETSPKYYYGIVH